MPEPRAITKQIITAILSAELLLGGQARLPFSASITPRLHKHAMGKATGTRDALRFIPIRDPVRHTYFIGVLMIAAGALVAYQPTRVPWGLTLTLMLTSAGIYSQALLGISYRLPVINSVLQWGFGGWRFQPTNHQTVTVMGMTICGTLGATYCDLRYRMPPYFWTESEFPERL